MEVRTHRGHTLWEPQSGGKAGKGNNVTGTIQVRKGGRILKQFRFFTKNPGERFEACSKATKWINNTLDKLK